MPLCSLAASNWVFSSARWSMAFYAECFLTRLNILLAKCFLVLQWLFLEASWFLKMYHLKPLQKYCQSSTSGSGSRASVFSSENCCWYSCLRTPPAWDTALDNGCRSCKISPVLHWNTLSLFLLRIAISCDLNLLRTNFRWWSCLQTLRIHSQKITSPTSHRVQSSSHEHVRKDFCAKLMHSTLIFWWYWIDSYFCSKWNDRPIEGRIGPLFIRGRAICE